MILDKKVFQLVEVDADTPFDRGRQYGEQTKEKIRRGIENYRSFFTDTMQADWETICAYARAFIPDIEAVMPDILEEARGLAHGAGVPFDELMVLNTRYELTNFPKPEECTTAVVQPEASADGKMYLIKNWDYRPGVIDNIVIVHIKQPDGVRIIGLTEAGQMIREGFNSHGIGLCNNMIQSIHDHRGSGIPVTFLRRRVLSSKTYEEALSLLQNAKRCVSNNMMLACADGRAIDLEASPEGIDYVKPVAGVLTHANHFVINPDLDARKTAPKNRCNRLHYLLQRRRGRITLEYIQECMRDHEYYPEAICNHSNAPDLDPMKSFMTVAGIIVDFHANVMHVCHGNPCIGEYKEYAI